MAKRSGLGQKFYLVQIGTGPGFDISGDVGSVDTAQSMFAALDDTGIDKSAHERIPGLGDGKLQYTAFWNNVSPGEHAIARGMIGLPVRAFWAGSAVEGDGLAYVISGILDDYAATRAPTGALTVKATIDSYNGDFPDWGTLAAIGTIASGTTPRTAFDLGISGAALTISTESIANPTVITTSTVHGLTSGDSVAISGTNGTPLTNGDYVATVTGANTFTIPINVTGAGSAGTVQKTSLRLGCTLSAVLLSIGSGTNFTLKAQHSADNGAVDTYTDLTGMITPSLTAAAAESRLRSSGTLLVKRWIQIVPGGTYTNAAVVAVFKRIAGVE